MILEVSHFDHPERPGDEMALVHDPTGSIDDLLVWYGTEGLIAIEVDRATPPRHLDAIHWNLENGELATFGELEAAVANVIG